MLRFLCALLAGIPAVLAAEEVPTLQSLAPSAPAPVVAAVESRPSPAPGIVASPAPPPPAQAEKAVPVAQMPGEVQQAVRKAPPFSLADRYKGIVKVEVACLMPDFRVPWRVGQYVQGVGTAFLVGHGLFMTNAHVVSNAERIYVSRYGDSRKSRGRVKYVAHDADLALIEIEDPESFAGVPYLAFDDGLPELEDEVRTIGYPIGGTRLSVTRGIVSRIDRTQYAHDRKSEHLAVQVDAAINPGNSGGPVLKGDRVTGVAFQGLEGANSTGYIIPVPVIKRFLKDVEDGRYDRYVSMGAQFMPIENPATRRYLRLPDDEKGALVADVVTGSASDGVLRPGDVLLKVQGRDVDSSGMVEIDGRRMSCDEVADGLFAGDVLDLEIQRDGKRMPARVTLQPLPGADVLAKSFDKLPRYVVFGGLLFQPMQRDVLEAHKIAQKDFLPDLYNFVQRGGSKSKEDVVLMTQVLPDTVNSQLSGYGNRVVSKVNGQEVKGLAHLNELLYPSRGKRPPYTVIEFENGERPVVFDERQIVPANARIAEHYMIPAPSRLSDERPVQP